jgi:hypothetical protein
MDLICIQDFGAHKVGDVVEVPDDAAFSPLYYAEKPKGKGSRSNKQPAQVANASDEALGENTDESLAPVVNPTADDEAAATDNDSKNEDE